MARLISPSQIFLQTLCPAARAASTVMGRVEPVREELVIGIFNRFLQGDGIQESFFFRVEVLDSTRIY